MFDIINTSHKKILHFANSQNFLNFDRSYLFRAIIHKTMKLHSILQNHKLNMEKNTKNGTKIEES